MSAISQGMTQVSVHTTGLTRPQYVTSEKAAQFVAGARAAAPEAIVSFTIYCLVDCKATFSFLPYI